jgi:hypothetical protein
MSADDKAAFSSRHNRTGEELAELRIHSPRQVLAVLDSVAISETRSTGKFVSRTDIVNRILNSFIDHKIDEAILINKAINENPTVVEPNK